MELLNSGAINTILGKSTEEMVRSLDSNNNTDNQLPLMIRMVDDNSHHMPAATNIPHTIENAIMRICTLVKPTSTARLTLGMNFWNAFEIQTIFCGAILGKMDRGGYWSQRFIHNFSSIRTPISEHIEKSREKLGSKDEVMDIFTQFELALISGTILVISDTNLPLSDERDASDFDIDGNRPSNPSGQNMGRFSHEHLSPTA